MKQDNTKPTLGLLVKNEVTTLFLATTIEYRETGYRAEHLNVQRFQEMRIGF